MPAIGLSSPVFWGLILQVSLPGARKIHTRYASVEQC